MNKVIKINELDNVAIALSNLKKGEEYLGITLLDDINQGHKFALVDIKNGENVIKYGYPIGHATSDIAKGSHIHSHNLATNLEGELEYSFTPKYNELKNTFESRKVSVFARENGKFGIRNNLMIIPLVGCVNAQAEAIKKELLNHRLSKNADNIIVASHPFGCSQLGDDHTNTVETLRALVNQPNNGGVLVLALGCENNQLEPFKEGLKYNENRVKFLKAQDVEDEVKTGVKLCLDLLESMGKDKRSEQPLSSITVGLKCGGSDGLSGITANPLVGSFSDYLVANGGTTVLSEVPEMFGAETILMERAENKEIFDKEVKLINDFKQYYKNHNQVCYENPSPGNKQGGITTLEEKSLGCIQKAGKGKVSDVLFNNEIINTQGLNLLNGPGNDMVACTNLAASGCDLILFTTGRGTPFGSVVPTIKISTNTALYKAKQNWIDFNAGYIADGVDYETVFEDFVNYIIDVINGKKTRNEINDFEQISIFKDGVTL